MSSHHEQGTESGKVQDTKVKNKSRPVQRNRICSMASISLDIIKDSGRAWREKSHGRMMSLEKVAVHRNIDNCNNKKNYSKAEDPLEKGMTTHSSILAWRIPWTQTSYSPWGRKESDTTQPLTLSLFSFFHLNIRKEYYHMYFY